MTTVTGKPEVTYVKGGLFREAGFDIGYPIKEQWFRRAEAWEKPYVAESKVRM